MIKLAYYFLLWFGFFWFLVLYKSFFCKFLICYFSQTLKTSKRYTNICHRSLQLAHVIRTVSYRCIFLTGNYIWCFLVLKSKDFTTLKNALYRRRQFIFFLRQGRTMALFCLMYTRASIKLPTLILFKAA